ncbi:MAG TPA: glycine zipper 2TM domain-containing protein [Burkholderiales bacterium]|jgi:uncharacterized protein YcfJ|nr:glycine zipper 2TM domain-containing protein [Burkholderiales bacterium]
MKQAAQAVTAAFASALVLAQGHASAYEAVASVVAAQPITEQVNRPTQQCWTESRQVVQPAPRNYLGAILGGVAGGLLGAQVGKGNGRVAGAAVGAGVGAIAGHAVANRDAGAVVTTRPVQRCEQVNNYETVITGYHVTYEYDGQRFSTRLPYDPGNQLRVNVAVSPR